MNLVKCFAAGCLGALLGAAVWAAISYFLHAEVGWIAWGIGFLAGAAVWKMSDDECSPATGGVAVAAAVLGVLVGKFLAVHFIAQQLTSPQAIASMIAQMPESAYIAATADEMIQAKLDAGETINWPAGMTFEEASEQQDYPPEFWSAAEAKWHALTPAERDSRKAEVHASLTQNVQAGASQFEWQLFLSSFDLFDVLWMGLATLTAYRLGSGNRQAEA